jgi:hypothetical protein
MAEKRISSLEREKKFILDSAHMSAFHSLPSPLKKVLDPEVTNRLQQWRRHRVETIEKEIAELRVQAASEPAKPAEEKKTRPGTPVPTSRLPSPPKLPDKVADLFDPKVNPLIEQLRKQGKKVEVFRQPVPTGHHTCDVCVDCGATPRTQCRCPDKQWTKRYTADTDIRHSS